MAFCMFAEVYASLWPLDPTPRLLHRLIIDYEFAAHLADSEKERCRYTITKLKFEQSNIVMKGERQYTTQLPNDTDPDPEPVCIKKTKKKTLKVRIRIQWAFYI